MKYIFFFINIFSRNITENFDQCCRVSHLTVEDSMLPGIEEKIKSSRLQIVVICPCLLKRVLIRPEQATHLSRHFVSDKVLAMMLGVQEDHLTSAHKSALISYQEWRKFPVKDQDENFVCQLFGAIFSILGTAVPSTLKSDKTDFTIHPKKVKLVRIIFFFLFFHFSVKVNL